MLHIYVISGSKKVKKTIKNISGRIYTKLKNKLLPIEGNSLACGSPWGRRVGRGRTTGLNWQREAGWLGAQRGGSTHSHVCASDLRTRPTCSPLPNTTKPWGAAAVLHWPQIRSYPEGAQPGHPQSKELALTGRSTSTERTGHDRHSEWVQLTRLKTPPKNIWHSKYIQNINTAFIYHMFSQDQYFRDCCLRWYQWNFKLLVFA